jgi:hypothetical protein
LNIHLAQECICINGESSNYFVSVSFSSISLDETELHLLNITQHTLDSPSAELARIVQDFFCQLTHSVDVNLFGPNLTFRVPLWENK